MVKTAQESYAFNPGVNSESNNLPSIVDAMRVAFDDPSSSDVKIVADGRTIHAHKVMLYPVYIYLVHYDDIFSENENKRLSKSASPAPMGICKFIKMKFCFMKLRKKLKIFSSRKIYYEKSIRVLENAPNTEQENICFNKNLYPGCRQNSGKFKFFLVSRYRIYARSNNQLAFIIFKLWPQPLKSS